MAVRTDSADSADSVVSSRRRGRTPCRHGVSAGSFTMMTLLVEEGEGQSSDSDDDGNAIAIRTQATAEYSMYA